MPVVSATGQATNKQSARRAAQCKVVPVECVVRGYLVGSGWRDYQKTGAVCGIDLPSDLLNCAKFETPLFTPATKAEEGHDENISFEEMTKAVGKETAEKLRDPSQRVYTRGRDYAAEKGIILADTKFEWVGSKTNSF